MKKIVPFFCLAIVAVLLLSGQSMAKADDSKELRIVDGVSIGNVDVSGLTYEQAEDAVENFIAALSAETFTLVSENGSVEATLDQMGLSYDVEAAVQEAVAVGHSGSLIRRFKETKDLETAPQVVDLNLKVDNQTTARLLYANGDNLNLPAVNMGLVKSGDTFTTTEGTDGNEVDYVASVPEVNKVVNAWTPGASCQVDLVCQDVKYKGTKEDLAMVTDVLGSFQTYFGLGATGREVNVANGCRCINGAVVYPGEEFSANAAMSPYTYENGYADGGSYENGQVVSSIGGGICQVSSTLYNAVIRAELEITKRAAHSMVVTYVDLSDDAAIAGDYKDLRFINNTDYPIYIEGYCSNGNIVFNVYGHETREANRQIDFQSETLSEEKADTNFALNPEAPLGYYNQDIKAHVGYKARLWKIVTVDGVEQSRDVFNNSTYRSSAGTTTVGIAGANEAQIAQINEAINQAHELDDDTIVENTVAALVAANAAEAEAQAQAAQKAAEEAQKKESQTTKPKEDTTTSTEKKETNSEESSEKSEAASSSEKTE